MNVDANDVIEKLKNRIADLILEVDIKSTQVEALLKLQQAPSEVVDAESE